MASWCWTGALKLDAQGNGRLLISRLPALDRLYWLKTEASLSDPSGERQTVSRWIALWPAATRVGVTASPAGKDGARWRVDALTLIWPASRWRGASCACAWSATTPCRRASGWWAGFMPGNTRKPVGMKARCVKASATARAVLTAR